MVTTCQGCGAEFAKAYNNHRYCSKLCRPSLKHGGACRVWFPKCRDCGSCFRARVPFAVRCEPCRLKARYEDTVYRLKMKVSKLLPYVGMRDGWLCGICHKPVVGRCYDPQDRMCPTIDHIIPVSHGGSDDLENLRVAHMACNAGRGNRKGAAQLALIG